MKTYETQGIDGTIFRVSLGEADPEKGYSHIPFRYEKIGPNGKLFSRKGWTSSEDVILHSLHLWVTKHNQNQRFSLD